MINPRQDLNGAVEEIQHAVFAMASSLQAALPQISLSIADMAKRQGVVESNLRHCPWRIPGYGFNPDASASPARWWLSTYLAWMEIPEAKRRSDWELAPMKKPRKARAA